MPDAKPFDQTAPIKSAWGLMKKNFWFLAGLVLIQGIISAISQRGENPSDIKAIFAFVFAIINIFVSIGTIKIILNLIDNKPLAYSELWSNGKYFLNYLLGTILYGLLVGFGLILLIIPGIYWAVTYQFVPYLIIDKEMSIGEAFRKSAEMTHGIKWDLFVFGILLFLVIIAGALCFGIGLFAAVPTTWIAYALVYRSLSNS